MAEKRTKLGALPTISSKFLYGFTSPNLDEKDTLGLFDLETGVPTKDVAFSPKNVKPNRAYKVATVSKGGFCSVGKVAALNAAGYTISRKNPSPPKDGRKSVIVGVKITANLTFAWRYPKTKWDALPATIKTQSGIKILSAFNISEVAYHCDGVILSVDVPELNLLKGTYYPKSSLKRSYTDTATGKNYHVYSGSDGVAPAP